MPDAAAANSEQKEEETGEHMMRIPAAEREGLSPPPRHVQAPG